MWLNMAELTFPQRTPEICEKACTNLDFSADNKPFALSALKRLHSEHEFMHLFYLQRYIPKLQKRVDIQDHMIAPPNSKRNKNMILENCCMKMYETKISQAHISKHLSNILLPIIHTISFYSLHSRTFTSAHCTIHEQQITKR